MQQTRTEVDRLVQGVFEEQGAKSFWPLCDLGLEPAELLPPAKNAKHLAMVPLPLGSCAARLPVPRAEGVVLPSY